MISRVSTARPSWTFSRTHHFTIFKGRIRQNPFYIEPQIYLNELLREPPRIAWPLGLALLELFAERPTSPPRLGLELVTETLG